MRRFFSIRFLILILLLITAQTACVMMAKRSGETAWAKRLHKIPVVVPAKPHDSVEVIVGTFLGGEGRNYYGNRIDTSFGRVWKTFLGKGTTIVTRQEGVEEWYGAGWTGQPLVVRERGRTYLIQGAYDHHLKKIDAATGAVIWEYAFDDILKGTGTLWKDTAATDPLNRILVMQGSRIGVQNSMASPEVYSYRAISYFTGKEVWRMNVKRGPSYSRDVDASAIVINDTAYNGLENGSFVAFDPRRPLEEDSLFHPRILQELPLYAPDDQAKHGGNLVTESSPAKLNDHVYVTAGSGHVYGYNLETKTLDWDFYIGSDIDGSPVVTADSCLLVTVEKQYIAGHGGVFKLNPRRAPAEAVEWFYPTGDRSFADWKGGVIGSAAVNDHYNDGRYPHLAAFTGIDGQLVVVQYDQLSSEQEPGPDGKTNYYLPKKIFSIDIGPSISTPIFGNGQLVAAGYNGIRLFVYDSLMNFRRIAEQPGIFESTPVADNGRIYVASRDGYLYCFGDTVQRAEEVPPPAIVTAPVTMKPAAPVATVPARPVAPVVAATPRPTKSSKPAQAMGVWLMRKTIPAVYASKNAKPKPLPAVVSTPVVSSAPVIGKSGYYLVAGAFRLKENAERSLASWKKKGYAAEIILSIGDLHLVSVQHATAEADLDVLKAKLRKDEKTDAWVFHQP